MAVDLEEFKQRLNIPASDMTLECALIFHEARGLEARGQFDDAVNAYKKVLELAPDDAVAYVRLASLYVQRRTPRAAVVVYVALAEMHIAGERWEKAALAYEKGSELAPDDAEIHTGLRDVYIKLGRLRDASKVQERIDRKVSSPRRPGAEAPDTLPRMPVPPSAPPNGEPPASVAMPPVGQAPAAPAPPRIQPPKIQPPRVQPPRVQPPRIQPPRPEPPRAEPPQAEPPRAVPKPPEPPAPARPQPPRERQIPRPSGRPQPVPPPKDAELPRARPRPRSESLGQILLDEKMVSREQLDRAIQMQHRSGGHLGRILVEQGALSEQQLAKVLSIQWGMPYVELASLEIDSDVVKVVPQHLAHRHKVLAIEKTRKKLKLAISDPLNVVAFDDVRLVTGLEIEPVVAAEQDIMTAIGRHYAGGVNLEEAMRQAAVAEDVEIPEEKGEEFSIEKLRTLTEEAPVVRLVNVIISQSIGDGASDIHIEPHRRSVQVRYRVDGLLHDVMTPPKALQAAIVSRIKIMANLDIAERRLPQDGRIHVAIENKEFDLRVSTLPTVFGEKVVMRILDQSSTRLGMGKLGFTPATLEVWEAMADKPYGMILVSGPTGSGKTTTLYSTLHKINTTDKNIVTVEDPVEYQLPRVNQVQINPKAGLTFANGLRSFLRQDPDIIMVGEIRDKETAEIAIQASLTGHLVLSTIHTNDAPSAATRLVDMGVEPFLISSSVIGVLAQRLARTICLHCKEAYTPPVEALQRLGLKPEQDEEIVFYRGRGCDRCKGAGYKGRLGIFELMPISEPIREIILKGGSAAQIRDQAIAEGMKTLADDGILKVLEGVTTIDELLRVVYVE
ncbi:MAG: type IV-A pilus assembly ATPase PilB [Bacillati bacterium ANGP1]|uniref:protein-secreting ATPase n=1 Tax=Candidatus Segetimicrobium genomatis TaxID=2569760 RepID=A0A537J0M9_9BACT|nr:MAG: type IV-A pilus assembly ATPase PilB [Terrabacteria group bacterium ANGP1]